MQAGIIGTGYAARARALALQEDGRCSLRWVVGHSADKTQAFAAEFEIAVLSLDEALALPQTDLVFIATANQTHAGAVHQALFAGKHVVVEYPLALDYQEAVALAHLAHHQQCLLHVEHIELLSPIHQLLKAEMAVVGDPLVVRYSTQTAAHPAPRRWSYNLDLFGFPMVGAVSRLSRLIDLLGPIDWVSCCNTYTGLEGGYFASCHCSALLHFTQGTIGEVTYAKGAGVWRAQVLIDLQGTGGNLHLEGDTLTVLSTEPPRTFPIGSRKGLFRKDTSLVLDHLLMDQQLYISLEQALYALKVAAACEQSALTGKAIVLDG
ncbi:Gfo/Idh/MocA family protein [Anthocerotibacter panamensis]|uniref:Gfo/Idh/MocA family protein n=1 Tax=Anthocerotibacter panamensis TaxID=2857077 RepID=UPI001C402990|nr:Gfo/Idh/MocA family oxidoreductase [Anthocerotibacter panamensis]